MINRLLFFTLIILFIIPNNLFGQWEKCSGRYASSRISKFEIINNMLIAGGDDGLIGYNKDQHAWDTLFVPGNIRKFTSHGESIYFVHDFNTLKKFSLITKTVDSIPLKGILPGNTPIHSIAVIQNRIYLGIYNGILYKSFTDSVWRKMETIKNIKPPLGVLQIIEFQNKLLCLTKLGIFISTDGNIFNESFDPRTKLKTPVQAKTSPIISGVIKGLGITNNNLIFYTDSQILQTPDLISWSIIESKNLFIHKIKPLCCNGIMISGFGLDYSFGENQWSALPNIQADSLSTTPNDFFIFDNKIFVNLLGKEPSIWCINFNYQLKF